MELAGLLVAVFAALGGVAAAIFAGSQANSARVDRKDAESARNESRSARDEAVLLANVANDAFKRQAEALERSNELEEAKRPKPMVAWQARPGRSRDSRILVNVGNIEARHVVASGTSGVHTDEDSQSASVLPDDSIEFYVMPVMSDSGQPRLHVEWDDDTATERQSWERAVQ
jgi:hypothetical protein